MSGRYLICNFIHVCQTKFLHVYDPPHEKRTMSPVSLIWMALQRYLYTTMMLRSRNTRSNVLGPSLLPSLIPQTFPTLLQSSPRRQQTPLNPIVLYKYPISNLVLVHVFISARSLLRLVKSPPRDESHAALLDRPCVLLACCDEHGDSPTIIHQCEELPIFSCPKPLVHVSFDCRI